MTKDTLKANIAYAVQDTLFTTLDKKKISGVSAPPGCGVIEVKDAELDVSVMDKNYTAIHVRTPAGPRTFQVIFKEVY